MTHLGITLPGMGYLHEHPVLLTVNAAMEQAGLAVERVTYPAVADWREETGWTPELVARLKGDVVADVTRAIETHRPDRVTLVGKSLGTYALGVVVREVALPENTQIVWLTPTWRDDATFEAALASPYPALYVIGTADPVHVPDRHAQLTNGPTVVLEGADHAFHIDGDVLGSIDGWRRVTAAVLDFVA